jgi:hypothetical protein
MRNRALTLLFVVALPLSAAGQTQTEARVFPKPALDELLKLVPKEAALAVVIPDLAGLAGGLQAFGKATGIEDLAEADVEELMDDLELGDLPDEWRASLRRDGPFVIVLTDPSADPLLICGIKQRPETPPDEHMHLKRNVLIWAPDAESLGAIKSASGQFVQRFEQRARPVLKNHQLALFLDVPSWTPQVEGVLSMAQMFVQMSPAPTTQAAEVNQALFTWLFNTLRDALAQTETSAVAARFDAHGLHFKKRVHFRPDGEIGEYLSKVRTSERDLLRGLVASQATVVFSGEWMLPPDVATLNELLLDGMLTNMPLALPDDDEWKHALREIKKFYRQIAGYNGSIKLGGEQDAMVFEGLYFADEPQAVFDRLPAVWKLGTPMMKALAPGLSLELKLESEIVGPVKAQVWHFTFESEDEQLRQVFQSIYGERPTFYAAPCREGVAYAMGPAEVARKNLERMLAGQATRLADDPRVENALRELSPRPQVLCLADLPEFMKWSIDFAAKHPGESPMPPLPELELPKTPLPYAAFGLYLHSAACGAELFVPAKALRVLIEWAEQAGETGPKPQPY